MYTFAYLGMPQIVIILVIALLIFGPQKVPELARQIGGALRDLKKMSNDVQSAFDLDDHHSYDRYESPSYEYSPPVSTSYDHGPLDQYGLPAVQEPHAIEALEETEETADASVAVVDPLSLELSPTISEATEATAAEAQGTETTTTAVLETETTKDVTSADATAASV